MTLLWILWLNLPLYSNQVSGSHKSGEIIKDKQLTQQLKVLSFNLKHIQLLSINLNGWTYRCYK